MSDDWWAERQQNRRIEALQGEVEAAYSYWIKLRLDRKQAYEAAENDKARLSRQANSISEALQQCHTRHKSLAASAEADREAILTVLT